MKSIYQPIIRDTFLEDLEGVLLNKPSILPAVEEEITTIPEDTPKWETYKPRIEKDEKTPVVSKIKQNTFTPVYTVKDGKQVIDKQQTKQKFISTFLPIYKNVLKEKGISEQYAKSLVAQAGHESD